eukprot:gene12607-biopygen21485
MVTHLVERCGVHSSQEGVSDAKLAKKIVQEFLTHPAPRACQAAHNGRGIPKWVDGYTLPPPLGRVPHSVDQSSPSRQVPACPGGNIPMPKLIQGRTGLPGPMVPAGTFLPGPNWSRNVAHRKQIRPGGNIPTGPGPGRQQFTGSNLVPVGLFLLGVIELRWASFYRDQFGPGRNVPTWTVGPGMFPLPSIWFPLASFYRDQFGPGRNVTAGTIGPGGPGRP